MEKNNTDEIDLILGYNLLKKGIKKLIIIPYKVFQFIVKKWIIILSLIILGVVLGFLLQGEKQKEAKLLLRINFDAVSYVYSSLELLSNKVDQEDQKFLSEIGFQAKVPEIRKIEITPIIKLADILERYESNDRNLEAVIKNIDFSLNEEEIEISESFMYDYKYHIAEIKLTSDANQETLKKIIDYLNDNKLLQQLKETSNKDILDHVRNNKETIDQINKVLNNYDSSGSLPSSSSQIYVVDKSFSLHEIIGRKIELQLEIETLNQYLVNSQEVVILANNPNLTEESLGLLGKKKIIYPIFLVFSFLFLAWIKHTYDYVKELAEKS